MNGWTIFWHWVIILAVVTYFGLGAVLTVGGFFDVKKMFRRLNELHAKASGSGKQEPTVREGEQDRADG